MAFFRVKTDMGYCGTYDYHFVEAESAADAEEVGWDHINAMVSVDVEEISEEEYENEEY